MINVSGKTRVLTSTRIIEPQVIVEIEGLPLLGANTVYKIPKVGDEEFYVGYPGMVVDGTMKDVDALPLISLAGSTSNITQQLSAEKGMAASASSFTADIVDEEEIITKYLSPGVKIDDLLGKKATVYLNHGKGAHPEDSIPVIIGVVNEIDAGAGAVKLTIGHPEGLKRQEIFTLIQTSLTADYRYRARTIQGIKYQTQDAVFGSLVTITYTSGATAGSEVVTVVNNAVTVQIANGVSTASQVSSAIADSQAAVNRVAVSVTDGNQNLVQTTGTWTLDSDTEIHLDSVENMLLPTVDETFSAYVRIGDEIIKYTGFDGSKLTGITPGQFDTIPKSHDAEDEVSTVYRLRGSMKEVALKVMMSGAAEVEGVKALSVGHTDSVTIVDNAIVFGGINVESKYGLSLGDLVSTTLSDETANNFTHRKITAMGTTSVGSYLVVDGAPLIPEFGTDVVVSFKSQYDVWPDGLGMQVDQVDVAEHEALENLFPSAFHNYDFRLDDTISGDSFVETEIYRPSGCYSIPRGGRSSVGLTKPPIAQAETITLDENNIRNVSKLRVKRSLTSNFCNAVVYKYEQDIIKKDFTRGSVSLSAESINRIPNVKNTPITIEAVGVRNNVESRSIIDAQIKRIFDRYQFGAESISGVEVLYKDGYRIDVGDTVIFGSPRLQLSDSTNGTRAFRPRVMEVVNSSKGPRAGTIVLDLLTTAYSVEAKYGVVSPSTKTDTGSTTSALKIKKSFATPGAQNEQYKWSPYFGQKIIVRTEDWATKYETTLVGFAEQDVNLMKVNPPLPVAPGADWIIECGPYEDGEETFLWKALHVFADPQVTVVSGVSPTEIEVSPSDIGKFWAGSPVRVHSEDYTVDSGDNDIKVKFIVGNNLTLSRTVGFTPSAGQKIDLIGFPDLGAPYRLL